MGISIKNEAVEADIRQLARLTGRSVTDAVWCAVKADLAREKASLEAEIMRKRALIAKLAESAQKIEVRDPRPMADILAEISEESA